MAITGERERRDEQTRGEVCRITEEELKAVLSFLGELQKKKNTFFGGKAAFFLYSSATPRGLNDIFLICKLGFFARGRRALFLTLVCTTRKTKLPLPKKRSGLLCFIFFSFF